MYQTKFQTVKNLILQNFSTKYNSEKAIPFKSLDRLELNGKTSGY